MAQSYWELTSYRCRD